jgi:TatD DNase family protein
MYAQWFIKRNVFPLLRVHQLIKRWIMFVDSHAHLYLEQFGDDIEQIIARAEAAQVTHIFLPNIDLTTIDPMLQLVSDHPDLCYPMLGLHPCSVEKDYLTVLAEMEADLNKNDYVAVGEIGIDLYWDKKMQKEQEEAFLIQCGWAAVRDLPIIVHCRDSIEVLLSLLEHTELPSLTGIFHCFTGTVDQAKRVINLGFLMGIGGVVTFKNSTLKEVIAQIDLKHLVLETDAPYLTPHPHRGKRNESGYIKLVAEALAEVYDLATDQIGQQTTMNALALFKIDRD